MYGRRVGTVYEGELITEGQGTYLLLASWIGWFTSLPSRSVTIYRHAMTAVR